LLLLLQNHSMDRFTANFAFVTAHQQSLLLTRRRVGRQADGIGSNWWALNRLKSWLVDYGNHLRGTTDPLIVGATA
jgi:hypothetical protein